MPSASSGMNSMKRTSTPLRRPNSTNAAISSSLTPRMTTQLTFTGSNPAAMAASMPSSTRSRLSAPCQLSEAGRLKRVQRHVHPSQARGPQIGRQQGQRHAVGGHGQVGAEFGQQTDQHRQVGPHGGLAAGESDAVDAVALDHDPSQPGDLLEGEQVVAGHPFQSLGGHAIGAPEVAPVGDRDPQVPVNPPEAVNELLRHRLRG